MKTTILKQSLILLSSATLLAACGGDGGDSPVDDGGANPGESGAQALLYAYPDNGQSEVPTKAPIALRFTSAVSTGNVDQSVTLCCDEGGGDLDFTSEKVPSDPRGVLLTPTERLQPQTEYTVQISDLRLSGGTAKDQTLTFKTRPLQEGPKSQVVESEDFMVDRQFPNGSELEPVMDFSAFRFQFTQPIDRATASYGDGNSVVLRDSEGTEVEAGLLVDGAYMTVDPTNDYLTPGETYTLELSGGLTSTYGVPFAGDTIEFTPKDSSPRGEPGFLVQKITQSGTSRLTGKAINQVPVNGVLLGEDANVTQAQSDFVIAELADVTQYTDVTPIRLPKGTLLEGTPIETVLIGGNVDAGFGSGDVTMRILSDATGYLVPNPYTENHPDKLRIVHLFMDVGIATANPQANGGFTQNLLHIHLVGVAEVDPNGGVLNIDATSMVEPDVLGLEYGYGLLSFQLQSYKDQTDALLADARAALEDTTPPTLQSRMPGQKSPEMPTDESGDELSWFQQPGAPIILNFDEPLDPASLNQPGALTVTQDGTTLDITHQVDGAAIVIQPEGGLEYSTVENNPEYTVQLGSQITDLAGNNFVPETLTFKLPGDVMTRSTPDRDGNYSQEDVQVNSPMLLSSYPGYPCVTDPATRDLANGLVGRCAGGPGDWPNEEYPLIDYHPDDNLPLMSLPANRPIVLQFTKAIDPASVELGGSFDILRVDAAGQPIDGETIQGALTVEGQRITFVPDEPWADGEYYSYTLSSNNDTDPNEDIGRSGFIGSEDAVCDGKGSICGEDGHPLRTQPLGRTFRTAFEPRNPDDVFRVVADYLIGNEYFVPGGGGPDLAIFFKGEPASNDVLQTLRTSPDVDVNGNLMHDVENTIGKQVTVTALDTPLYLTDPWTSSDRGRLPDGTLPTTDYPFQEAVPSVPDPNSDPAYDPEGVQGLPNSAKILSMNTRGTTELPEVPWFAEGTNFAANTFTAAQVIGLFSVDGGNVGCGYDEAYDPVTGEPGYDVAVRTDIFKQIGHFTANEWPEYEPTVCPEKKFTYLKMGLNASVGGYDAEKEAIKVEIYPSQSISTSFVTYARNAISGLPAAAISSGEQIMRMRYAKDDPSCVGTPSAPCRRTQPITGWIADGGDQGPVLTAEVDLYIDAPFIGAVMNSSNLNLRHNLRSYQATMSLSGPVSFLDDGRMLVQQRNENPIDINVEIYSADENLNAQVLGAAIGRIPYRIPQDGVFLKMVSEPIKAVE
ncbi:MAG: Ig-like domain-containing protein [Alcanivorax sp.]|nr:Ig-like domain-containing protein [Alcanivorax sp.]